MEAKHVVLASLVYLGENLVRLTGRLSGSSPVEELSRSIEEMAKSLPEGWRDDETAQILAEKHIQIIERCACEGLLRETVETLLQQAQDEVLGIAAARKVGGVA